jgi:hypothetical protein
MVDDWNRQYRPGQPVRYYYEGRRIDALTRTEAWVDRDLAVIEVEGRSGYLPLSAVDPIH